MEKKDKSKHSYPYIEYDAEIRVAYVHMTKTQVSHGCINMSDITAYVTNDLPESQRRERILKRLYKQAVQFNIDGAINLKDIHHDPADTATIETVSNYNDAEVNQMFEEAQNIDDEES